MKFLASVNWKHYLTVLLGAAAVLAHHYAPQFSAGSNAAGLCSGIIMLAALFLPSPNPRVNEKAVDVAETAAFDAAKAVGKPRGFASTQLLLALVGVGLLYSLAACAWFKQNEPTIRTDLTKDGICVLTEVATGNVDPVSIGVNCGGIAVAQVETLVAQELDKLSPDAGVGVGAGPLSPNMLVLLSRLQAVKRAAVVTPADAGKSALWLDAAPGPTTLAVYADNPPRLWVDPSRCVADGDRLLCR